MFNLEKYSQINLKKFNNIFSEIALFIYVTLELSF